MLESASLILIIYLVILTIEVDNARNKKKDFRDRYGLYDIDLSGTLSYVREEIKNTRKSLRWQRLRMLYDALRGRH